MSSAGSELDETSNETLAPVRWGVLGASNFAHKVSLPGMNRGPLTTSGAGLPRYRQGAGGGAVARDRERLRQLRGAARRPRDRRHLQPAAQPPARAGGRAGRREGKHVLCEKPIALDAQRPRRSRGAARDGKLIREAFMVRHHPQWQRARTDRRAASSASSARADVFSLFQRDPNNMRNKADIGGGALYDIGCYAVNTSRYLFGAEPGGGRADRPRSRVPYRPHDHRADRLRRGPHLTFTCAPRPSPYQRVNVFGTKGRIEIEIPFNAPRPARAGSSRRRIEP